MTDPSGLRSSSPVYGEGRRLGTVTEIHQLENDVLLVLEIDPEYRGKLSRQADFEVVKGDGGGELHLTRAFGTPAIEDGNRIDARPGWLDRMASDLQGWKGKTEELLGGAGAALAELVEDLRQSPEIEAIRKDISELARDISTVSRDRYQSFVREKLPEVEKKAREYRQKLLAEGREKEAEIFWKWFERWATAMRESTVTLPAEDDSDSAQKPAESKGNLSPSR